MGAGASAVVAPIAPFMTITHVVVSLDLTMLKLIGVGNDGAQVMGEISNTMRHGVKGSILEKGFVDDGAASAASAHQQCASPAGKRRSVRSGMAAHRSRRSVASGLLMPHVMSP